MQAFSVNWLGCSAGDSFIIWSRSIGPNAIARGLVPGTILLLCQLAQAKSLREICGGLACTTGKLRHPGLTEAPNKSTLSYAKAHRPWQMFQDLFYATLDLCKATAPRKRRFRFKNKLLSLDSTADWRQPDFPEHDLNSLTY
ncbi:MAG: DUF4372 domain-containing protein [Deltaproteobacteria bacterium]|nr:DUF4372 domain-containing protein [Deltaproteobacteria bacterium]